MTQPDPLHWVQDGTTWSTTVTDQDGTWAGTYRILAPAPAQHSRGQFAIGHLVRYNDATLGNPDSGGYPLGERWDLESAQALADQHRYRTVNADQADVPEDHPAVALRRFFWPISDGTTRAALTLRHTSGGRLHAQVVGMSRGRTNDDGESPYWPGVYADLPLSALVTGKYFVADDGEGTPTLWRATDSVDRPDAILRRTDVPADAEEIWEFLTAVASLDSDGSPAF